MLKLAIMTSYNPTTGKVSVKPVGITKPSSHQWAGRTYTFIHGGTHESGHLRAMRRWADKATPNIGPVVDTAWHETGYIYTFGRLTGE